MGTDSVDVFFDALLTDSVMKKIVRLIAQGKDDEEIIGELLSIKETRKR